MHLCGRSRQALTIEKVFWRESPASAPASTLATLFDRSSAGVTVCLLSSLEKATREKVQAPHLAPDHASHLRMNFDSRVPLKTSSTPFHVPP